MSNNNIDTSHLSKGLIHSIETLWSGREMSADMKDFFNHYHELPPELQAHWEKYYQNLEKMEQNVNQMDKVVAGADKKEDCSASRYDNKPKASASLKAVENGKNAVVLNNGKVIFGDDPGPVIPRQTREEALSGARTFGAIRLLAPCPVSRK